MRTLAGSGSHIHFTSLSKPSSTSLSDQFRPQAESEGSQLANVKCHQQGILDLMRSQNVSLDQVCLLDPKAEQILSPLDGDGKFSWFLFGVSTFFLFFPIYIYSDRRLFPSNNALFFSRVYSVHTFLFIHLKEPGKESSMR